MWEETFNTRLLGCLSHSKTVTNRCTISFIHSCSQTRRISVTLELSEMFLPESSNVVRLTTTTTDPQSCDLIGRDAQQHAQIWSYLFIVLFLFFDTVSLFHCVVLPYT